MSTQGEKYYSPKIPDEQPLQLDKNTISYADSIADNVETGIIEVQVNKEAAIARLSKGIYANASSGFRELFNNEARAARISKKQFNVNPTIEIVFDLDENKLMIHGIDSLGIPMKMFKEVCAVIGISSNLDGNEVGQFGMGLYSYTVLSDIVILETYSRETNEKFAVMGKNGVKFQILPQPDLQEYGTRVILTIREDVDVRSIIKMAVQCAKFCGIDTHLTITGVNREKTEKALGYTFFTQPDGKMGKIEGNGRYKIGSFGYEEYITKRADNVKTDTTDVYHQLNFKIEDDDFLLVATAVYDLNYTKTEYRQNTGSLNIFLANSPITVKMNSYALPTFTFAVLNIKNERKYHPTADRERLEEKSTNAIIKKVQEKIRERFSIYDINSISEYLNLPLVTQLFYECGDYMHNSDFVSDTTKTLIKLLNTRILKIEESDSYKADTKYSLFQHIVKKQDPLVLLPTFKQTYMDKIRTTMPNAVFFKFESGDILPEMRSFMEQNGIIDGIEYIKENNIKVVNNKNKDKVKVYWRNNDADVFDISSLGEDVLRVPRGTIDKYRNILERYSTKYGLVVDIQRMQRGIEFNKFLDTVKNKQMHTSDGLIHVKDFMHENKKIILVLYHDYDIINYIKNTKQLYVFGTYDDLFEINVLLEHLGKEIEKSFVVDTTGRYYSEKEDYGKTALDEHLSKDIINKYKIYDHPMYQRGASEIVYGIIHVVKSVQDEDLVKLFLDAERGCNTFTTKNENKHRTMKLYKKLCQTSN